MSPPPHAEVASPSPLVLPLLGLARARGARLDLGLLGLPAEPTEALPVTLRQLGALLDAVAEALDERHLGLVLPGTLRLARYELPALAAHASPTLRESFQRLSRYSSLLADGMAFTFEEDGGLGRLRHQVLGHPRGVSRHLNEFAMATGVHECRLRTGVAMRVREVCFVHPRPGAGLEPLTAYFGASTPLRFGHRENTLVFDAAVLDAPQRTADARLLLTAEALAEDALRRRPPPAGSFREVVARRVRAQLDHPQGSLRGVALGLRMSSRTLQRRLEAEGTRFAAVLDEVREGLARELVSGPNPSLSEVAFSLGFAEFATFSRAFKRWTGVPPGAFRLAAAGGRQAPSDEQEA